jgi:DNA-binding NarL/FixJ family response regulator
METRVEGQAPVATEVPMVSPEEVKMMVRLAAKGWGTKRIARELGLARNTVRKYTSVVRPK